MQKQNKNGLSNLKFQGRFQGKINLIPKQGITQIFNKKIDKQNPSKQKLNPQRISNQNTMKSFTYQVAQLKTKNNVDMPQNQTRMKKSRSYVFQKQKLGKQNELTTRFQSLAKQKLHDLHLPQIRKSINLTAQAQRGERYINEFQITKKKLTTPSLDFFSKNSLSKKNNNRNENNQVEQYLKILNQFQSKLKDLSARSNIETQRGDKNIRKNEKMKI